MSVFPLLLIFIKKSSDVVFITFLAPTIKVIIIQGLMLRLIHEINLLNYDIYQHYRKTSHSFRIIDKVLTFLTKAWHLQIISYKS